MIGRRGVLGLLSMAPTMAKSVASEYNRQSIYPLAGNAVPPPIASKDLGYATASQYDYKKELSDDLKYAKDWLSNFSKNADTIMNDQIRQEIMQLTRYNSSPSIDWDIRNMRSISDVGKIHMQAKRNAERLLEDRKMDLNERVTSITKRLLEF